MNVDSHSPESGCTNQYSTTALSSTLDIGNLEYVLRVSQISDLARSFSECYESQEDVGRSVSVQRSASKLNEFFDRVERCACDVPERNI